MAKKIYNSLHGRLSVFFSKSFGIENIHFVHTSHVIFIDNTGIGV